jgi:hypothetical protein
VCTLSWFPEGSSYHVVFNRDEQRERTPAVPPAIFEGSSGKFLAPLDPPSQGTWLAVTDRGLTFGVLNFNQAGVEVPVPENRESRGTLIMDLAGQRSSDRHAVDRLVARDLTPFQPFIAVGLDIEGVTLVEWDGTSAQIRDVEDPGLVMTTSSFDPDGVTQSREGVFALAQPPTLEGLRATHRSHQPERSAYSVCMHREDAATLSLTEVSVAPESVEMRYAHGPSCQAETMDSVMLPRVASPFA